MGGEEARETQRQVMAPHSLLFDLCLCEGVEAGKEKLQVQQIILTMLKLWSCPRKNGQLLLELDEHGFHLWLLLLHYYTQSYSHFKRRLSACTENCTGQGTEPFNEQLQTWLKLKQEAHSLGLRCPWQTGGSPRQLAHSNTAVDVGKAVLSLLHEPWGRFQERQEPKLSSA